MPEISILSSTSTSINLTWIQPPTERVRWYIIATSYRVINCPELVGRHTFTVTSENNMSTTESLHMVMR